MKQMQIEIKLQERGSNPAIIIRGEIMAGGYSDAELSSFLLKLEHLVEPLARAHINVIDSSLNRELMSHIQGQLAAMKGGE